MSLSIGWSLQFDGWIMIRSGATLFALEQRFRKFGEAEASSGSLRRSKDRSDERRHRGGMKNSRPTAQMPVDDVMRRWPSTIRVFLDFRMRCVGCPIAAFHSIDEACEEHGVDAGVFLPRILEAVA